MTDLSSVPTDELLAMYERSKLPRGLRNNNPGNIEDGAFARGLPGYQGSDGRFAVFDSMESGQAAKGALLQSYGRRGFNTVEKVVGRWAPPSENDTGSYVQFVSQRLGVDPRQPLDLDNPQTLSALQAAIAERENGPQAAPARDVTSMSTDELLALYKGDAPPAGGPVPDDAPGPAALPGGPPNPRAIPRQAPRTSQSLGLAKGLAEPWQRTIERGATANAATRQALPDALATGLSFMDQVSIPGMIGALSGTVMDRVRGAEAGGTRAGKVGEFVGNVGATLPFWMLNPMAGGGMSGLLTSKADDTAGLATDAGIGAVAGKVADEAARFIAPRVGAALSKAPKPPSLEQLREAYRSAYAKVDASGFKFPASDIRALANDVQSLVRDKGGPKAARLLADSDAFAARLSALARQPGGIKLSQLDDLRSDIYPMLIQPRGKDAPIGKEMLKRIDALIDAAPNADIKGARAAYSRFAKTREVMDRLTSADLRQGASGTGGNTNAPRQQLRPLVDPKTPNQNLRGATTDEKAAINRLVNGTPLSEAGRYLSSMDPFKGRLSAMLQGGFQTAAIMPSGGLSLLAPVVGMGGTLMEQQAAKRGVQQLLSLIAAGGSKQALVKAPTVASRATQATVTAAPLAAPVGAVQARESRQRTGAQTKR